MVFRRDTLAVAGLLYDKTVELGQQLKEGATMLLVTARNDRNKIYPFISPKKINTAPTVRAFDILR